MSTQAYLVWIQHPYEFIDSQDNSQLAFKILRLLSCQSYFPIQIIVSIGDESVLRFGIAQSKRSTHTLGFPSKIIKSLDQMDYSLYQAFAFFNITRL